MNRALRTLLLALVALAAVPAATALAAGTSYPTITKVAPMRAEVGDRMAITGRNFLRGANRNTVVFQRAGTAAVFVKADRATTTRLSFTVPEKLARFLVGAPAGQATKFRVNVLARRFGRRFTALTASPTILPRPAGVAPALPGPGAPGPGAPAPGADGGTTPAPASPLPPDCDRDGSPDDADANDDADLLDDDLEKAIGTDRCLADTDLDGMRDDWEYQSARDLNRESCPAGAYPTPCAGIKPYPGTRPYPNPLDPADAKTDYDGDWLPAGHEHEAAKRRGITDLGNLWYSDGLQSSQDTSKDDLCVGMPVPAPWGGMAFYSQDRFNHDDPDGCLNDSERDEDNDGLINVEEAANELSGPKYWELQYQEKPYKVAFRGTDWLNIDTDGDGTADGLDDQDHDDFLNIEEVRRGHPALWKDKDTGRRDGLWVHPFNPCLPSVRSRTCPAVIPLEGDVWPPFTRDGELYKGKRWPLYGRFRRDAEYFNWPLFTSDGYIDPLSDGNAATPPGDTVEWWLGPVSLERQDQMPPPHPLPR